MAGDDLTIEILRNIRDEIPLNPPSSTVYFESVLMILSFFGVARVTWKR